MLTSDTCFCDGGRPIILDPEHPLNVKIKDYSRPLYQDADEQDFEIRTIAETQLVNNAFEFGDKQAMEENLYNFGDEDDLPESDRAMQNRKIRKNVE